MKEINDDWKKITLRKYLEYTKTYYQHKDHPDLSYLLLSVNEGKTPEELKTLPLGILQRTFDRWSFLNEDFSQYEEKAILDLGSDGTFYIRKDFGNLSLMQWQNIDELIKMAGDNLLSNIHLYLGIVIQEREKYDYDKAVEYSNILLETPMYYIIPNINFFLREEETSSIDSALSSIMKIEEEALENLEATLNRSIILVSSGVGMGWWRRWLTKTYLKLIRFWLKRSKTYSFTLRTFFNGGR